MSEKPAAKTFAPRLHVLLARDSSKAVIIRRGPSRKTAVIGWDRKDDTFEVGQWLNGRIYERRCDLSPDGKHFIYFAMNGRWDSEVLGAWTAISRAPYLKADGLWPKGNCWNGGGLFTSNKSFWLNDGPLGHKTTREAPGLKREAKSPSAENFGGECPGVYYPRLQRDGWTLVDFQSGGSGGQLVQFTKRVSDYWSLVKIAHATTKQPVGKGCYFDEHALRNENTGETVAQPDWEWAEVDGSRIVWAADGKLFAGKLERKGMTRTQQLFDAASVSYAPIAAPY